MKIKEILSEVTMEGKIDKKTFRRFALFDSFIRKKGWRSPVLFVLIMSGFAAICFSGRGKFAGADLLGGVLLGIGLILPSVWFLMFLSSVNRQAKANRLSSEKTQYTVTLSRQDIHVHKEKEKAVFSWDDVAEAYRTAGCIYLYINTGRAFLLPDCKNTPEAWKLISDRLPEGKAIQKAAV